MTITYTWLFTGFEVALSENGLSDVVKTIHWRYRGTDEQGYFADTYGSTPLPESDPESFVPFDQITKQWAIDQVTQFVNTTEIEELHARKWQGIVDKIDFENSKPSVVVKFPPLID